MAKMDFSKAGGNFGLNQVLQKSAEEADSVLLTNIPIELIDENPDNEKIFNMNDVDTLSRTIEKEGFTGAIEVLKKPDGRYEISSGHRRYRAIKELGKKTIPCIISTYTDETTRAKKLLSSNINNRILSPLDWARALQYYTEKVAIPSGKTTKAEIVEDCSNYFNWSRSKYYRYYTISKLQPELQELCIDEDFPSSALAKANKLSLEQQHDLYLYIKDYMSREPDAGISKAILESLVARVKNKPEKIKISKEDINTAMEDIGGEEITSKDAIGILQSLDTLPIITPSKQLSYTTDTNGNDDKEDYEEKVLRQMNDFRSPVEEKRSSPTTPVIDYAIANVQTTVKNINASSIHTANKENVVKAIEEIIKELEELKQKMQ